PPTSRVPSRRRTRLTRRFRSAHQNRLRMSQAAALHGPLSLPRMSSAGTSLRRQSSVFLARRLTRFDRTAPTFAVSSAHAAVGRAKSVDPLLSATTGEQQDRGWIGLASCSPPLVGSFRKERIHACIDETYGVVSSLDYLVEQHRPL